MADPVSILERIVKLALLIKGAVDTVRRNEEECHQIWRRAVRVSSLLSRLPETGITDDPAICDTLDDLEEALQRAHALVTASQEASTLCRFCIAGKQARKLRRAQEDISEKVMLVIFATNIQTTIMLTNMSIGDAPPAVDPLPMMIRMGPRIVGSAGYIMPAELRMSGLTSSWSAFHHSTPTSASTSPQSQDFSQLRPSVPLPSYYMGRRKSSIQFPRESMSRPRSYEGFDEEGHEDPDYEEEFDEELEGIDTISTVHPRIGVRQAGFQKFSYSELEVATNNFSMENMIGSGASSSAVYRGVLHDGLVVAIKKFQNLSAAKIDILHCVSVFEHKNIVKFIGYGYELLEKATRFEREKVGAKDDDKEIYYFFVEEYLPDGSLDKIMNGSQLDWLSRFQIIQGIAHGLRCLHEQRIVHLDVKPSNVLLDCDMNPKITDFGTARVLKQSGPHIEFDTTNIEGTLGYMPPEYITDGMVSTKHDVYGFGVTILETIRGMSKSQGASDQASVEWVGKYVS